MARHAIFNSHTSITIQSLFTGRQYGNTRHDAVDFRAGFRFSADGDEEPKGATVEENKNETADGALQNAEDTVEKAVQETEEAADQAQSEGKDDGHNADPAHVTYAVAESTPIMKQEVQNALSALEMALKTLQSLVTKIGYLEGFSEAVAENTPEPPEGIPGNSGRRFQARPPSLLQRLNQQSAPQRYRLQSRGRTRR